MFNLPSFSHRGFERLANSLSLIFLYKALDLLLYTNSFVYILLYTMAKPFVPQRLPLSEVRWEALISRIGSANRALAYYDGVLKGVANPGLLLSP